MRSMFIPFMNVIKVIVSKICVVIKQIEHLKLLKFSFFFFQKFITTVATNTINIPEGIGNY